MHDYRRHTTKYPPFTREQEVAAAREIVRLRDAAWEAVLLTHTPTHVIAAFDFPERECGNERGSKPERDAARAFARVQAEPLWRHWCWTTTPDASSLALFGATRDLAASDLAPLISRCDPDLVALTRATGQSTTEWRRLMAAVRDFEARNIGLCYHHARRFWRLDLPFSVDDLAAYGFAGLRVGVLRFDVERGLRFSTYASGWVRHYIGRAIDDLSRQVRLPVHVIELAAQAAKIRDEAARLGLPCPTEEMAERLGVKAEKVRRASSMCASSTIALDAPVRWGNYTDDPRDTYGTTFLERSDDDTPTPDDTIDQEEHAAVVREAMEVLPARHREIIARRYGDDEETLSAIGRDFGLSRERIRQIEQEGLSMLRVAIVRRRKQAGLSHGAVTC